MTTMERFKEALKDNNKLMTHIILKDSLIIDPTFKEFDQMLAMAEKAFSDLYDAHNGDALSYDKSSWNKEYLDIVMARLVKNFSKERIALSKDMCSYIYSDKISKIENSRNEKTKSKNKRIGAGISVGGATIAAVGLATATKPAGPITPITMTAGIIIALVGGVMMAKGK